MHAWPSLLFPNVLLTCDKRWSTQCTYKHTLRMRRVLCLSLRSWMCLSCNCHSSGSSWPWCACGSCRSHSLPVGCATICRASAAASAAKKGRTRLQGSCTYFFPHCIQGSQVQITVSTRPPAELGIHCHCWLVCLVGLFQSPVPFTGPSNALFAKEIAFFMLDWKFLSLLASASAGKRLQ